jgi:hypothetical protein
LNRNAVSLPDIPYLSGSAGKIIVSPSFIPVNGSFIKEFREITPPGFIFVVKIPFLHLTYKIWKNQQYISS